MNFGVYVIKPLNAGSAPFIFQAPSDLVAIKTLLCSTVNLRNGHKLYDYNLELIDTGLTLSPDGVVKSPLISRPRLLGDFNQFFSKIDEYEILHKTEEVTNG